MEVGKAALTEEFNFLHMWTLIFNPEVHMKVYFVFKISKKIFIYIIVKENIVN